MHLLGVVQNPLPEAKRRTPPDKSLTVVRSSLRRRTTRVGISREMPNHASSRPIIETLPRRTVTARGQLLGRGADATKAGKFGTPAPRAARKGTGRIVAFLEPAAEAARPGLEDLPAEHPRGLQGSASPSIQSRTRDLQRARAARRPAFRGRPTRGSGKVRPCECFPTDLPCYRGRSARKRPRLAFNHAQSGC
jgi:hypothetical protein